MNDLAGAQNLIKLSSLLNVSYGSSKSVEFNLNDIEVLVDRKEQNWFKRAHIGRYLGITHLISSIGKLPEEDVRSRSSLRVEERGDP